MEKDIEKFVKRFADENDHLKHENEKLREEQLKGRSEEEIKQFKSRTAEKIDQITEALDSNMRQN